MKSPPGLKPESKCLRAVDAFESDKDARFRKLRLRTSRILVLEKESAIMPTCAIDNVLELRVLHWRHRPRAGSNDNVPAVWATFV